MNLQIILKYLLFYGIEHYRKYFNHYFLKSKYTSSLNLPNTIIIKSFTMVEQTQDYWQNKILLNMGTWELSSNFNKAFWLLYF